MKTIIQQITQELAKKIIKDAYSGGIHEIDELAASALTDCKQAAKAIIETIVAEINREIRANKDRRKTQGLVLKEKDRKRALLTELGTLNLPRDYYYDKTNARYVSLLDHVVGIEQYARIGDSLSARLVELATDVSYAKSAAIATGGSVSRQAVRDHILKLGSLEKIPEVEEKKQVRELHVYADEDHVHMQKPHKERGKRNKIVPLVTVSEGIVPESKRRNKTVCPMHFVDEDLNTANLWKSVEGYIGYLYKVEELEAIYLHGDGGKWIKNGLSQFQQTVPVMDGYHLEKRLKQLSKRFSGRSLRRRLEATIAKGNRNRANEILESLFEVAQTKRDMDLITTFRTYLMGNWRSIVNRKTLDIPGSCTEAQVSHVLSERFSRDPLGWSEEGLGILSKLRVYVKNGGKITGKDFKRQQEPRKTYSAYADQILQEGMSGAIDWSIFDGEAPIFDGASGTQVLIEHYGSMKNHLIH